MHARSDRLLPVRTPKAQNPISRGDTPLECFWLVKSIPKVCFAASLVAFWTDENRVYRTNPNMLYVRNVPHPEYGPLTRGPYHDRIANIREQ